jgi:hypothetical protein
MKVKTISCTYDRKFNMGDFNSAHIAITMWADIEENECANECASALREMCREHVKAEAMRLLAKQTARVTELFMGLPKEVQEDIIKEASNAD